MADYLRHVRTLFVDDMAQTIAQSLQDRTPEADYSKPSAPSSTYAQNIQRLRDMTAKRLAEIQEVERLNPERAKVLADTALQSIQSNLRPPYKARTDQNVDEFKDAGADSKDTLVALLEAFDQAKGRR